jgi:5-methyltetrahydropteroyltriglutamate--homocysteine methyltransferase
MTTTYHAEHVGSMLRPPELLEARRAHRQGSLSLEQLRELEDQAVLAALAVQREAGLEVFTDGEMRRATWMASILESLDGVVAAPADAVQVGWHRDRGGDPTAEETHFDRVIATGKLGQKVRLTGIEADFMARHSRGVYKVTMMSASMGSLLWRPGFSDSVYPRPGDMMRDLVEVQLSEIRGLLDQGVRWIQLDSLSYNQAIDEDFRRQILGDLRPATLVEDAAAIDNALIRGAREHKPDVTVGLHMCRGNNRSAWMAQGSYEPVAEKLLGEVDVDRFLLEYDTERAGSFEALRFVPPGKTVVLGLISSKFPELESQDDLLRRIDEAARYVAMEDLALSPQCGFASTAGGNVLTVEEEKRKLELVVETARRAWA